MVKVKTSLTIKAKIFLFKKRCRFLQTSLMLLGKLKLMIVLKLNQISKNTRTRILTCLWPPKTHHCIDTTFTCMRMINTIGCLGNISANPTKYQKQCMSKARHRGASGYVTIHTITPMKGSLI